MRQLELVEPIGDMYGITARVTLDGGKEFYVCNPIDVLTTAMDEGKPFRAHMVVGMKPKPIIVNPVYVAIIEDVS